MFDLNGTVALVTGSTQGIGLAIARLFCRCGARVYVHCSNDGKKAEAIAKEIGAYGSVVADLSEDNAAEKLFKAVPNADIVVANASVQVRNDWEKITPEEYELQTKVNLFSTMRLMQLFIPPMQERGFGRFIAVGSVQQYNPHPKMAVYAATKCAIQSLVENVAKQAAPYGVTVNNLIPGVILTPRNDSALADGEYRAQVLSKIPARDFGTADDCAAAALYLASREARYVTGIALTVDGGMKL